MSIGHGELERDGPRAGREIGSARIDLSGHLQPVVATDLEIGLNRVHLRDAGQDSQRGDQIPYLNLSDTGDSANQGTDLRVTQVELRLLDSRLIGLNCGFRAESLLPVSFKLHFRNGVRLGLGNVPVYVQRVLPERRLRFGKLTFCLIQCGLKGARIDLKQNLILMNVRSFAIVLPDDFE